jgi:hypothetical protein
MWSSRKAGNGFIVLDRLQFLQMEVFIRTIRRNLQYFACNKKSRASFSLAERDSIQNIAFISALNFKRPHLCTCSSRLQPPNTVTQPKHTPALNDAFTHSNFRSRSSFYRSTASKPTTVASNPPPIGTVAAAPVWLAAALAPVPEPVDPAPLSVPVGPPLALLLPEPGVMTEVVLLPTETTIEVVLPIGRV